MKCAICDREDETVTHNNTDCRVCQAVIYDTIAGYDNDDYEEVVDESFSDEVDYGTFTY